MFVNLFYVWWRYQQEVDESAWVIEGRDWKKIVIIASFDHFAQVTNELDMFLPPRFPFQKDVLKPLLFGTGSRWSFSPGGTTSPQLEQPRFKSLYCAPNNQSIATLQECTTILQTCLTSLIRPEKRILSSPNCEMSRNKLSPLLKSLS